MQYLCLKLKHIIMLREKIKEILCSYLLVTGTFEDDTFRAEVNDYTDIASVWIKSNPELLVFRGNLIHREPFCPFYTHGGQKHLDEFTAFAILKMGGVCDGIRRLEQGKLEKHPTGIHGDILGVYDPSDGMFDHHHKEIILDGFYRATAGLVWEHYGVFAICNVMGINFVGLDDKYIEFISDYVEENFIRGIDANDADPKFRKGANATCSGGDVVIPSIIDVFHALGESSCIMMLESIIEKMIKQADELWEFKKYAQDRLRFDLTQFNIGLGRWVGVLGMPSEYRLTWRFGLDFIPSDVDFIITESNHPGASKSLLAMPLNKNTRDLKIPIIKQEWFNGFIHLSGFIAGHDDWGQLEKLAIASAIEKYGTSSQTDNSSGKS